MRQKLSSFRRNPLVTGTLLLTGAGFISRFIGFFYRIFLSHTFGEEGMGIYQLIGPVMAVVYSLCTAGLQTAISKFVAASHARGDWRTSLRVLLTGFSISAFLSCISACLLYQNALFVANRFLLEPRCASLLRICALSIPPACIHACINGYYYGIRKTGVPSASQLIEQIFRVGTVFVLWKYSLATGSRLSLNVAAIGMAAGEFSSMLLTLPASYLHFARLFRKSPSAAPVRHPNVCPEMIRFALPLSANRICLNLLQTAEAAWLPASLQQFGYSNSQALSLYGVLTGMAMTLILFPGAFTNSVSVLLMPLVSEADSAGNAPAIRRAILKCIRGCLLLGILCLFCFLLGGPFFGAVLFHSEMAGRYIMTLSFICPFLYLNTTLFSILNGLGKTTHTFLLNLFSLFIRLLFIRTAVPVFGMKGYLWGMLAAQLFLTGLSLLLLRPWLGSAEPAPAPHTVRG